MSSILSNFFKDDIALSFALIISSSSDKVFLFFSSHSLGQIPLDQFSFFNKFLLPLGGLHSLYSESKIAVFMPGKATSIFSTLSTKTLDSFRDFTGTLFHSEFLEEFIFHRGGISPCDLSNRNYSSFPYSMRSPLS